MRSFLLVLVLGTASIAQAASSFGGPGGAIPDFAAGVPGMFQSSVTVSTSLTIVDIDVQLTNLVHTWSGDLRITLTKGATTAVLVDRVGATTSTSFGDSSDYSGTYVFDSDSAASLWTAAAGVGGSSTIQSGTYDTSDPLTGAPSNALDVFDGLNLAGTWTLTITDHAGGDTGSLGGFLRDRGESAWFLIHTPEPSSFALLACAAIGLRRRR